MKRGNYGLDAPAAVIGYSAGGALLLIIGILLSFRFTNVEWMINLGGLFFLLGLYMAFGSKFGKYRMRKRILDRLSIRGGEMVLDVGCGRGLMLNGAAARLTDGKAYGIDIWSAKDQSGNNCAAVMKNAEREGTKSKIEVIDADMRKMPFADGTFDLIVSSLAIHNLGDDGEMGKALNEIARVAKNGCHVAILDLANIDFYAKVLSGCGFSVERISKRQYWIFPPVRVLYAEKIK